MLYNFYGIGALATGRRAQLVSEAESFADEDLQDAVERRARQLASAWRCDVEICEEGVARGHSDRIVRLDEQRLKDAIAARPDLTRDECARLVYGS